ncbi:hypothetical protein EV421DRAFT_1901658 [Armillaria borealis]|uniref:DUF202 domain-containing protein n=1 Tax=Armillaria borealis TaxID=47425 RepID=A0AA39JQT9_9AGAR|nr:hypothetical protein EV421DRAFT_1901658 [Armillaria borealis]
MHWTQVFSRNAIENSGSTARDFCMLERNMLAHIKLALLLSVLSSSLILQARLVPTADEGGYVQEYGMPLRNYPVCRCTVGHSGGGMGVPCRLSRSDEDASISGGAQAPFRYHDRRHGHCVHHLYNLARQGRNLTKMLSLVVAWLTVV